MLDSGGTPHMYISNSAVHLGPQYEWISHSPFSVHIPAAFHPARHNHIIYSNIWFYLRFETQFHSFLLSSGLSPYNQFAPVLWNFISKPSTSNSHLISNSQIVRFRIPAFRWMFKWDKLIDITHIITSTIRSRWNPIMEEIDCSIFRKRDLKDQMNPLLIWEPFHSWNNELTSEFLNSSAPWTDIDESNSFSVWEVLELRRSERLALLLMFPLFWFVFLLEIVLLEVTHFRKKQANWSP